MFIGSDDYSPRQNFYQIEKTRQALPSSGLTEGIIALKNNDSFLPYEIGQHTRWNAWSVIILQQQ